MNMNMCGAPGRTIWHADVSARPCKWVGGTATGISPLSSVQIDENTVHYKYNNFDVNHNKEPLIQIILVQVSCIMYVSERAGALG